MTTYKGLTVQLGAVTKGLTSALRETSKGARETQNELKQVQNALKFNPSSTRLLTRQMELLADKANQAEERLKVLKAAEEQIDRTKIDPDQWTKLQAEIATCESKVKTFNEQLATARAKLKSMDSTLGKTGAKLTEFGNKYDKAGQKVSSVGDKLTSTLTPALIGSGAAAVAAATDMDTSLTNVRKTVDGTEQQYQALKDAAVEFSKTNAVSASQILDIQALGAQLGFTIDELDEFGEVVSGLDIATDMDAETAATQLAQFANITKMSHDEISNYGSAVVGLGNNFATTESKISAMAMRIAAAGTQVGMSQADILGLSTALSSLGIEAEAGGSAISTIMSNIDKDVATGSDSLAAWASTAQMSAEQFAAAWKSDPVTALAAVLSGLESATEAGGNMSLMLEDLGISELRQTDAMKRMAGNSQLVADAVGKANEEWSRNSALSKEVENRNGSLAAKFQILLNKVIAVADDIGGPLADALLDALDAMDPFFKAVEDGAQAFADMDDDQQRVIISTVALVAALGPLLKLIGGIPSAAKSAGDTITSISEGFTKLKEGGALAATGVKMLNGAIGAVVIGTLAAFAASLIEAKQREDELAEASVSFAEIQSSVATAAEGAAGSLDGYASSLDDVVDAASDALDGTKQLNDSIKETFTSISTDGKLLDGYVDTIERLANKSDLSASEQAELKTAVEGYNSITGDQLSVVDSVNGKIQDQNGVLLENIDALRQSAQAWIDNAKAQASQDLLIEAYKQQAEAQDAATEAHKRWQQEQQKLENGEASYTDVKAAAEAYEDASTALGSANDKVKGLEATTTVASAAINANLKAALEQLPLSAQAAGTDIGLKLQEGIDAGKVDVDQAAMFLTDGVKTALASLPPEQQANGIAVAMQLAEGISMGSVNPQLAAGFMVDAIANQVDTLPPNMQTAGMNAVMELATQLSNGTVSATEASQLIAAAVTGSMDGLPADLQSKAGEAVIALNAALSNGDSDAYASGALLKDSAVKGASNLPSDLGQLGTDGADQLNSNLAAGEGGASQSGMTLEQAASAGVQPVVSNLGQYGTEGGESFATGVGSAEGSTSTSASSLADATEAAKANNSSASGWGSELGKNFADGIKSAYQWVADAASSIAQAAADFLHHTQPKKGPLSEGEEIWGKHLSQNFAKGMDKGRPTVGKAAKATAQEVADYLEHSQPKKGPLSQGEWIYGYHAAINFAEGLSSGKGAVGQAAEEVAAEADRAFQEYIDSMIAGYKERGDEFAEVSTDIADAIWGIQLPAIEAQDFIKPLTGSVYDSMKQLESAGYTLDQYADKLDEMGKKKAEWDSKVSQGLSDSEKESYQDFLDEYNAFVQLQDRLSASLDDMRNWSGLYEMKDTVISTTSASEDLADALRAAGQSGATFSQEFIDYIVNGGEDAVTALKQLTAAGPSALQEMSDSFRDMAIAEQEAELNARSLYVNSLKYTNFKTQREQMVEYRGTVLDVREAMYGDNSLAQAFERTGTSAEGFAADLMSVGMTMEDFQSQYADFTSSVSNGFSQMTKYNQTSLDEWSENLKLNMAEAQEWSSNLQEVFSKVPESIDSEAFRKAILEGGFDQWGKVIDEMAGQSSEAIQSYIELYNESIKEAQLSGIEAFKSLAPGEEMVQAMIEGMQSQQGSLNGAVTDSSGQAVIEMLNTAPQWESAGATVAGALVPGIMSQASAIASAAAAVVSQAIAAAQAAASGAAAAGQAAASSIASRSVSAASQMPAAASMRSMIAAQAAPSVSTSNNVSMSINVSTRPGQTVDVRGLAKEIVKEQNRAARSKGIR